MKRITLALLGMLFLCAGLQGQDFKDLTPKEAFDLAGTERTFIVDVRSVAEYVFVGHPEMAFNIPLNFWDEKSQRMSANQDFISDLESRFQKDVSLIFICKSGGRSRRAAQAAYEAGYASVYNVVEGFEGGSDEQGYRTVGGWKNSLPYTYRVHQDLKYSPGR